MDIRTLCLGILALGDATGYEIKKMVAEGSFSFFSEASFGSIYPALTKLTEDGFVTCESLAQEKRPDKKVYRLTAAGQAELERLLSREPGPDRNRSEFLATLLFVEATAPSRLGALVADRIAHHEERIRDLEQLLEGDMTPVGRFVVQYGLATQRAARDYLRVHAPDLTASPTKKEIA